MEQPLDNPARQLARARRRQLAMTGERFLLRDHVELRAVCVHPEARGRGFGTALTGRLARDALLRGGFRKRATPWGHWHGPSA